MLFIGDNDGVARGRHQCRAREDQAVHADGHARRPRRHAADAGEQNFFNTQGQGYLLIVLAAVFIGGTSIFGGQARSSAAIRRLHHHHDRGRPRGHRHQGFWVRAVRGWSSSARDLPPGGRGAARRAVLQGDWRCGRPSLNLQPVEPTATEGSEERSDEATVTMSPAGVAAIAAVVAQAASPRRPMLGDGRHDVHADGRQAGRRRHLGPPDGAGRRRQGVRRQADRAVFGLAAGEDAGRSSARRWPRSRPASSSWAIPGNDAFADLVKQARRPGHRRHRRQRAADRAAAEVRPQGLRLCRRRPLRGRRARPRRR